MEGGREAGEKHISPEACRSAAAQRVRPTVGRRLMRPDRENMKNYRTVWRPAGEIRAAEGFKKNS